ncbi:MAG: hypothetical protein ACI9CD_000983, partial [Candidatus Deianiraeaceae bacterium]
MVIMYYLSLISVLSFSKLNFVDVESILFHDTLSLHLVLTEGV